MGRQKGKDAEREEEQKMEAFMGKKQKKLGATSISFNDVSAVTLTFIVCLDAGT